MDYIDVFQFYASLSGNGCIRDDIGLSDTLDNRCDQACHIHLLAPTLYNIKLRLIMLRDCLFFGELFHCQDV